MEGTNLLGKSHKQYVQDQIKVRQEKLGKLTKDSTDIAWMNGKTSWVRLASSVNIENSTIRVPLSKPELFRNANYKAGGDTTGHQNISPEINTIIKINLNQLNEAGELGTDVEIPTGKQRLELLDLDESFMGSTLAEKLVLVGGSEMINFSGENNTPQKDKRKGVSNQFQNSATSNFAYSSKNGDFGLVAMPGIESVDIKSKSMGSLREANVSIRVNDAEQLELIETLYLRLGYSMFLEWGNSSYFRNDGEYVKGALTEPGLIYDFLLQKTPTQQEIDAVLLTKMSDLNGDGVEEPLTKQQLADFETQIDSIQVFSNKIEEERKRSCGNYDALFGKVTNFSWEFDPSGFYNVTLTMISWGDIIESLNINTYFPDIVLDIDDLGNPIKGLVDRKNTSALEAFIYEATLPAGEFRRDEREGKGGIIFDGDIQPTKNTLISNTSTRIQQSWWKSRVETQTTSDYSEALNYDRGQTNSKGKVISCNAIFGGKKLYSYVRFGDLLDFIKYKLLIYNVKSPIVDIDTTPGRNFCYNPQLNVSADPSKVMVRRDLPSIETLTPQQLDSINPDIRKSSTLTSGPFSYEGTFIESFDAKVPGTNVVGGDIMNIYFEKEYLYSEIDRLRDAKTGKMSLYHFIQNLLSTVNNCLGGVNELDLRVKDDRIIEIYDQIPLYGVKKEEIPQQFNIYGIKENGGSFVSNFGLKTELTNEFATTVAIGAQAQGDVLGEDSTMLSRWNFGLVDRFIPKKVDSIARDLKDKDKELKELSTLTEKMKSFWISYQMQLIGTSATNVAFFSGDDTTDKVESLRFPLMQTEQFPSFVSLQKNFFKSLIKLETNSQSTNPYRVSNQIGMLPINLNLEMDGLSGIRIYDQINVDTRFLPSYYPNYLIFIVKGVSHSFNGNRWVTKIDTIAQPKVQYQKDLDLDKKFSYGELSVPDITNP